MERERERKGRKVEKIKHKKQAEGHKTILKERGCKGRPRHPKMRRRAKRKEREGRNKLARAQIRKARTKARHP